MKKEKDTALKNLLNLKEDYILDLDKYKDSENLSFKEDEKDKPEKDGDGTSEEKDEDGTADEEDADESSEETDDDETAEESEEDEDPNNRKITDDGKNNEEGKKEPKKPVSKYLQVEGLPEIFDAMKKAESAADVGQSLKSFLTKVRKSSVEALVKTENQNKEENQNEEPAKDPKKEK